MPATFPQTLWLLKERGLTVTVREGGQTSLAGPADMVTPDLIEDLKAWKQEILAIHANGEPLLGPPECPEWREYLLKGWKPSCYKQVAGRRVLVPYVGITDWVQMTIRHDPHQGVLVSAIGWRWWCGETAWRPMPRAYYVSGS